MHLFLSRDFFKDAFAPPAPPPRSKPWERARVSAHAPRLHGQKIWKRAGLRSQANTNKENIDISQLELEREGAGARKKPRVLGAKRTILDAPWKEIVDQERDSKDGAQRCSSPRKKDRMSIIGSFDDALLVPRKRTNANHLITPRKTSKRVPLKDISSDTSSPQKKDALTLSEVPGAVLSANCSPKKSLLSDAGLFRVPTVSPEKAVRRRKSLRKSIHRLSVSSDVFQFAGVERGTTITSPSRTNSPKQRPDLLVESLPTEVASDIEQLENEDSPDVPVQLLDSQASAIVDTTVTPNETLDKSSDLISSASDTEIRENISPSCDKKTDIEAYDQRAVSAGSPEEIIHIASEIEEISSRQAQSTEDEERKESSLIIKLTPSREPPMLEGFTGISSLSSSPSKSKTPRGQKKNSTPQQGARRSTRSTRYSSGSSDFNESARQLESGEAVEVVATEVVNDLLLGSVVERAAENLQSTEQRPSPTEETEVESLTTTDESSADIVHVEQPSELENSSLDQSSVVAETSTPAKVIEEGKVKSLEIPQVEAYKTSSMSPSVKVTNTTISNTADDDKTQNSSDSDENNHGTSDDEDSDTSFSQIDVTQEITQGLDISIGPNSVPDIIEIPAQTSTGSGLEMKDVQETSNPSNGNEEPQSTSSSPVESADETVPLETENLVGSSTPDPTTSPLVEAILENTKSVQYHEDDTDLLRNFLTRVKANKEAKAKAVGTKRKKSFPHSPIKLPLGNDDETLSLSPSFSKEDFDIAPSMCSPAKRRKRNEEPAADEVTQPQSMRRSARTRLPVKTDTLPAPSFIPVRRLGQDGDNTVTLRRSDEKELAALTKINTRKNKGNALNVFDVLASLSQDNQDPAVRHQALKQRYEEKSLKSKNGKSKKTVVWAEEIAEYSDGKKPKVTTAVENDKERPATEERKSSLPVKSAEEKKATPVKVGVRSSRIALGMAVTGTPAPKRKGRGLRV